MQGVFLSDVADIILESYYFSQLSERRFPLVLSKVILRELCVDARL